MATLSPFALTVSALLLLLLPALDRVAADAKVHHHQTRSREALEKLASSEPVALRAVQAVIGVEATCYGSVLKDIDARCSSIKPVEWIAIGARLFYCDQQLMGRRSVIPWCPLDEQGLKECTRGISDELVQILKGNAMAVCEILDADKMEAKLHAAVFEAAAAVRSALHAATAELLEQTARAAADLKLRISEAASDVTSNIEGVGNKTTAVHANLEALQRKVYDVESIADGVAGYVKIIKNGMDSVQTGVAKLTSINEGFTGLVMGALGMVGSMRSLFSSNTAWLALAAYLAYRRWIGSSGASELQRDSGSRSRR